MNTSSSTSSVSPVVRFRAVVRGRVTGVGYRFWTHHTAAQYPGLSGYVRNDPDETVEVEAEHTDRTALEAFLRELQHGPTTAHVENVEPLWEENVPPRHDGFHVA